MNKDVSFFTQGEVKLVAHLKIPEGSAVPCPGVLLLPALVAGDTLMQVLAERLAAAGIASLALDFRGCGRSEGEKGWLDPFMRLEDARNAFAWMTQCEGLDGGRIGVWGHRFSAPVAIGLGADEARVRAVVGSSGPGSGTDFMRSLRNGAEWLETLDRVRADRLNRALTGRSELVTLDQIIPMQAFLARYGKKQAASSAEPAYWLANIDAIMRFHTEDLAARLGNRPLLLVNGERDEVIAIDDVRRVYEAASGPKRLAVLAGLDHAGMEVGEGLEQQISLALEWFGQHL
jgi:uncharacterized protein